ncbi:MAG: hypothetical protein WCC58_10890 [Burkholderiales bacterium]
MVLARAFGTSESFWIGVQVEYDLKAAREQNAQMSAGIEESAAK